MDLVKYKKKNKRDNNIIPKIKILLSKTNIFYVITLSFWLIEKYFLNLCGDLEFLTYSCGRQNVMFLVKLSTYIPTGFQNIRG